MEAHDTTQAASPCTGVMLWREGGDGHLIARKKGRNSVANGVDIGLRFTVPISLRCGRGRVCKPGPAHSLI